jgi:hypothetical protein
MARMSRLSSESLSEDFTPHQILTSADQVHNELQRWWQSCPPALHDQPTDWRRQIRPTKLTVSETLQEEGISSVRSCVYGCIIYINHIMNPVLKEPQSQEVKDAIREIVEIAKETPEGYGLEMGLYFGLFMAGIAVFNDSETEDLLRRKMKADTRVSIYVCFHSIISMRLADHDSMRIAPLNCLKFSGEDNIDMVSNMTGDKYKPRWVSKCMFLLSLPFTLPFFPSIDLATPPELRMLTRYLQIYFCVMQQLSFECAHVPKDRQHHTRFCKKPNSSHFY